MEPTPQQAAEGAVIIDVLAAVLDQLVTSNSTLGLSDMGQITKFHALKSPGISIRDYLVRIYKFASCSNECYVLALVYIDRLIQRSNFLLTELNVHRVVITAILLAAKFFDDAYYNNAYYARIGGVLASEINGLEVDFLFRINFSLRVTPELFTQYRDVLMPPAKQQQICVHAPPTQTIIQQAQPFGGYEEAPIIQQQQQQQTCSQAGLPQQSIWPQHSFPMCDDANVTDYDYSDAALTMAELEWNVTAAMDTIMTETIRSTAREVSPFPSQQSEVAVQSNNNLSASTCGYSISEQAGIALLDYWANLYSQSGAALALAPPS